MVIFMHSSQLVLLQDLVSSASWILNSAGAFMLTGFILLAVAVYALIGIEEKKFD